MGNIQPYEKKIPSGGLISSFGYQYALSEMQHTNELVYYNNGNPYLYIAQGKFIDNLSEASWQSIAYFGLLSGKYFAYELKDTHIDTMTIFSVEMQNADETATYYLEGKISSVQPAYHDASYDGYWYRSMTLTISWCDSNHNTIYTLSTSSFVLYWYEGRDISVDVLLFGIRGQGEFPSNDPRFSGVHDYVGVGVNTKTYNPYSRIYGDQFTGVNYYVPISFYGVAPEEIEVSESMGDPAEAGDMYGGGSFDDTSDTISMPSMPSVGLSTSGCCNIYEVTSGELQNFINELFPPFNGLNPTPFSQATSTLDALINISDVFFTAVSNIFPLAEMWLNKGLVDFVVDCHLIPCSPSVGAKDHITVGWKTFTQMSNVVTSDYVDVDCGTLSITEYFGNFADYLTQAQLFLPFIGYVPAEPEFWQAGTIGVTYRFNIVDGSFMAYVTSTSSKSELTNSVIAQYSGSCCVHIPITGTNYASIFSGGVQGALGIASSAMMGNALGVGQSVAGMLSMRPEKAGSNSYSASSSFLSMRTPFLLIARPSYYLSQDYVNESGLPDGTLEDLTSFHGYTELENPVMTGFTNLDDEEQNELKQILTSGFYM